MSKQNKQKPWTEAASLNGQWAASSNVARARSCIEFLKAHGFLSEPQAGALHVQVRERSAGIID